MLIFVIIATPTDYNTETSMFDTSSVENSIKEILSLNKNVLIIVKSTIPIDFIDRIKTSSI